jgi:hypothetical protein
MQVFSLAGKMGRMSQPDSVTPAQPPRPRSCLPILIGMALGAVLAFFLAGRFLGGRLPEMSRSDLTAARERWQAAGIADYEIEVEVQSRQLEKYRVIVAGGEPQEAWRNDRPLKQVRTFDTWSVPGMFDTIETDVEASEDKGNAQAPKLTLQAEFDTKTGVPLRYRRIEWGKDVQISWQVTKFAPASR